MRWWQVVVLAGALAACGGGASSEAPTPGQVTVPPEGSKFEPAVEVSAVPAGAWMCDMGTVHYAAGEKGDGTCPVCGMNLTQKH